MIPTGAARVAGVMGWPVTHSLSPLLHGYWLNALGVDGAYVPFAVRPDDLAEAVSALPRLGLTGVNLTVPHKERTLRLMHELDDAAEVIGAVNTVTVTANGSLRGRNTDAYGFRRHLEEAAPFWRTDSGAAVIVGAGGAARAVTHALRDAGVTDIRVVNRTPERARTLLRDFGLRQTVFAMAEARRAFPEAALVVNATSLGMKGGPAIEINLEGLPRGCIVYDLVYAPLETPLLAAARNRGHPCVDGLGMLIHQAVPAFEAFFGVRPEVTADVRRYLLERAASGAGPTELRQSGRERL